MPITNIKKTYLKNGVYHVYNHGIDTEIFRLNKDLDYFVALMHRYLDPQNITMTHTKNYCDKIALFAFSLTMTHFHMLLKQRDESNMAEFMQSLQVSYTSRFNRERGRRGHLFESTYKARLINSDYDLLNMSKYIHLNPNKDKPAEAVKYAYSSAGAYIKPLNKRWTFVDTSKILSYFNDDPDEYEKFLIE